MIAKKYNKEYNTLELQYIRLPYIGECSVFTLYYIYYIIYYIDEYSGIPKRKVIEL